MTGERVWIGLTNIERAWRAGELGYLPAQGIEAAAAAETVKLGSVHESPVGSADAPKPYRGTPPMTPTDAQIALVGEWIDSGFRVPNCAERVAIRAIYTAMESARDPDELREALITEAMARAYLRDRVGVAKICDETLDHSGALLGYIREASRNRGDVGHD